MAKRWAVGRRCARVCKEETLSTWRRLVVAGDLAVRSPLFLCSFAGGQRSSRSQQV